MLHLTAPKKSFLRSTKPGTSLLVALGLTTTIVLVSLGVTSVVVSSIRDSANANGANQAYYASEGALEAGLLFNQQQGAGYTGPNTPLCGPNSAPGCLKANYKISGQVGQSLTYPDGSYGIPTPGTGNVGQKCDQINPDIADYFTLDSKTGAIVLEKDSQQGVYPPEDNPCNWNKLKVGETVSIPLYYSTTDSGGKSQPPTNIFDPLSVTQTLAIRIRTACPDGAAFCANTDRPDLDTSPGAGDKNYNYDDPIVSWQVTGQSADGSKTYVLSPYLKFDPTATPPDWKAATTIIYENKIKSNKATGYEVLKDSNYGVDSAGCRGKILDFLNNSDSSLLGCAGPKWVPQGITKPVLKLSVIHSLDASSGGGKIPYLEYQILTNGTKQPPTDTNQTITAEGYSGTFKQVLEVKNPQQSGLLEYVIQQ